MVYESYTWKQDLLRRKRLFLKYNTGEQFAKNEDSAYTVLEKTVFYSAFIIRKLIDCLGKTSDEADQYVLHIKKYRPLKEVNIMHRWPNANSYDWDHPQNVTVKGKDICNWLIHSYIFFFIFSEDGSVEGFAVASDFDRNKALYYVSVAYWLEYMTYIANDYVVTLNSLYDPQARDYIFTRKERGSL